MPPSLALLGCAVFVLLLLRWESKESVGVSHFLWVPTIWFLIMASRSLALWFGTGGSTIEEGSYLDQIVQLSVLGIAIKVLVQRRFDWSTAFRESRWLLMLLFFMLLSCVWSEMPAISFRRWLTYAIAVIVVWSIQSEAEPRRATEAVLRRVVYICIPFSYLLINYYQEYGKIYVHTQGVEMWTGVAIHKNSLAELCMVTFLLVVWRLANRQKTAELDNGSKIGVCLELGVFVITLSIFMGPDRSITYSATTLLSTLVAFCVLGFFKIQERRRIIPTPSFFILVSLILIAYGTVTPFLGKLSLFDVSAAMGRNSTLTGRTEVWASLVPAVMQEPFLGAGVGGFWTTKARVLYDISGAHNGYLGLILELGFFGWTVCMLFLLSFASAAARCLHVDYKWGMLCMMFLFSILTHNIGEESINCLTARLTAVLILLHVSCARITTLGLRNQSKGATDQTSGDEFAACF